MIPYPLLLRFLRRGIGVTLFCGLTAALFGLIVSSRQAPTYRSTASFIVSPASAEQENLDFGDVVYGIDALSRRNTVATYAEVFGSERVFDLASDSLSIALEDLDSYSHSAVVLPETSIIRVTVDGPDATIGVQLVNALSAEASAIMGKLYGAYEITSLDQAKIAETPIRPNPPQDTILAAIIGLLLGVTIAIIRTPEIVTGKPDDFLAERGIAGSAKIDPMIAYKMRRRAVPVEPSTDTNGITQNGTKESSVIRS